MIKSVSQSTTSATAIGNQTIGKPSNVSQILLKKDAQLAKADMFLATVLKGSKIAGETLTQATTLFEKIKIARMGLAMALVDENEEDVDKNYNTLTGLRGEVSILLPGPGSYYLSVD